MYKCEICGAEFAHPYIREYTDQTVDCKAKFLELLCPECFTPDIDEANSCPGCDGFKFRGEILCKTCRADLLKRFTAFADELTAEEAQQLDDWLDGVSITERKKWG